MMACYAAGNGVMLLLLLSLLPLAMQVMADEGVIAPLNQYVQVYLNGQFYGLFGMIEKVWVAAGIWGPHSERVE